jgi:hypothetical protein
VDGPVDVGGPAPDGAARGVVDHRHPGHRGLMAKTDLGTIRDDIVNGATATSDPTRNGPTHESTVTVAGSPSTRVRIESFRSAKNLYYRLTEPG